MGIDTKNEDMPSGMYGRKDGLKVFVPQLFEVTGKELSDQAPHMKALFELRGDDLRHIAAYHPESYLVDKTGYDVPQEVIQAVERISQHSQHNSLMWLNRLRSSSDPVITQEDKKLNPDVDFEREALVVRKYAQSLLSFHSVATIKGNKEYSLQEDIDRIAAIVAVNKIMQAVIKKQTEATTESIKLGLMAGFLSHGIEHFAGQVPPVFATVPMLDNVFAIKGEMHKLKEQGYSLKERLKAMRVPIGVMLASLAVATQVDTAFEKDRNGFAGFLYGSESAICVFPSLFGSLAARKNYYKLVGEGKVDDPDLKNLLLEENPSIRDRMKIFLRGVKMAMHEESMYPHHTGFYKGAAVGILLSTAFASVSYGGKTVLEYPMALGMLGVADGLGGTIGALRVDTMAKKRIRKDLSELVDSKRKINILGG